MEPFYLVAADPGGTTGLAVAYNYFDSDGHMDNTVILSHELGPMEHHLTLWDYLEYHNTQAFKLNTPMHVVFESFEYRDRARAGLELISKEYIGVAKLFTQRYNGVTYSEQMPSHAMRVVTDEKLEKLGLFRTPKTPMRHQNDALRHLIYYMVFRLRVPGITERWRD